MILKIDEGMGSLQKVNLPEPTIEINREEMYADITYEPQSNRVTFSISDTRGRIICTGDLSSGELIRDNCHGSNARFTSATDHALQLVGRPRQTCGQVFAAVLGDHDDVLDEHCDLFVVVVVPGLHGEDHAGRERLAE